jgi:hypothetical protein
MAVALIPVGAVASHQFTDVPDSNIFHTDIAWLADNNITKGCNPPANDKYCPGTTVTREQMAAFMRRLAVNRVVDADKVDGQDASAFQRVFAIASGDLGHGTGAGSIPASTTGLIDSVAITAPADGVLIVNATSSWDVGGFDAATWAEVDAAPACNAFGDGDSVSGTNGADTGGTGGFTDSGGDTATGTAQTAGIGAVPVSAGPHVVSLCIATLAGGPTGTNLGYAISAEWIPTSAATITVASAEMQFTDAPVSDRSFAR